MPFPLNYTHISSVEDMAGDLALDRQRGFLWAYMSGGAAWDYNIGDWADVDGPLYTKIRASDGQVVFSGRGAIPYWGDAGAWDSWYIAVSQTTGNIYVDEDHGSSQRRIQCLDQDDLHVVHTSPYFTGTYTACDFLVVHDPYVYVVSVVRGASPPCRIGLTRLPLDLSAIHWVAEVYNGADDFNIDPSSVAIDSAGNAWVGAMKILARVSPTGTVTSFNLTTSLNAAARIRATGYDPVQNILGMLILNYGGTPATQIVRFSCATNTVNATVSFASPNSLEIGTSRYRVWDYLDEGHVLVRYQSGAAYPNASALLDFDLRNMVIARTYRPQDDWGIYRAPVTRISNEEPVYAWRRGSTSIYDPGSRAIWFMNSFGARIYPSEAHPLGEYGVWRLSLSPPATYLKIAVDNWAYDRLMLDHHRGILWQHGGNTPEKLWKIRASDGVILSDSFGPDVPPDDTPPYWYIYYLALSQQTGNIYFNDDSVNNAGRIRCIDGNTLGIIHTSAPLSDNISNLWVIDPYVYVETWPVFPGAAKLARFSLDLSVKHWEVDVWPAGGQTGLQNLNITVVNRNIWCGRGRMLWRITPPGVVTSYDLTSQVGTSRTIVGTIFSDQHLDLLVLFSGSGVDPMLLKFDTSDRITVATDTQADWGFGKDSIDSSPNNLVLHPAPNGYVWLRLTATAQPRRGDFVEYDIQNMRRLRRFSLTRDWQLTDTAENNDALAAAQNTSGFVWDACQCCFWLFNAARSVYSDAESIALGVTPPQGWYGLWKLPLPDTPVGSCQMVQTECGTYTKTTYDDWAYDRVHFDRQRAVVWQMSTGGPHFYKFKAQTGELLYADKAPGIPDYDTTGIDWAVWYIWLSQQTGNLYINDDEGAQGRVRCLSGTDLTLLHTSPYVPTNLFDVFVKDSYVYTMDGTFTGSGASQREQGYLTRFPLDLSRIDWRVQVWDVPGGNTALRPTLQGHGQFTQDSAGNVWLGIQTHLYRVSPTGVVTVYNLNVTLVDPPAPAQASHASMVAIGYDASTNCIVGYWVGDFVYPRAVVSGLFRFSLDTYTVIAYEESPYWDTPRYGGCTPNNWERLPGGRLWMRLGHPIGTMAQVETASLHYNDMTEIKARTFQIPRHFELDWNWCLSDERADTAALSVISPLYAAASTSGYVYDDCSAALWIYNADGGIYPDAESIAAGRNGWYGMFRMPLPDQPAADCPREPCGGFESFHDVLLDQFISYGCKIRVKFQTFLTRMREGHEERIGEWQDPIWTFDITPALRDQADLDYLLAFFRARHGPLFMFKFVNPLDYQVANQYLGSGDGSRQEFQLCRHYDSGIAGDSFSYVRPIVLPIAGAQIFQDGVLLSQGAYSLELLGGAVRLTTPPPPGATITWTGSYYTPVRFLNNRIYSVVEHYEHFEDQIMLVEERIPPCAQIAPEAESPDFVEVRFPDRYAQRATMGPEIDVITITSDSGGTFRTPQFRSAKIRFTVEETEQPQTAIASILAFFLNRKGRLYGFRAKDITDFTIDGPVLESADGTRTQFQLVKRYGSGAQSEVRTITKPNQDVVIHLDGVPADPQPTVEIGTGKVIFASPPAAGVTPTATGTFDVPVRFDSDEIMFSIQGFEAFNLEAIGLLETELGLPDFAVETPLPALMAAAVQAAPMPRLGVSGQDTCALPPRPAVTQYLEFRGGTTGSGAGAYSGLQVETPGGMYTLLASASSLTVAFLVSHVKSGTPSGALGAVYPMALFSHVMPGMGTDPALYPSTGFTLYLGNFGLGVALDASLGAYAYAASGALCVPQLTLTPRVPAQGAASALAIADNNAMHAYVVTMDWVSRQAYWSGTIYGRQDFPLEAFAYTMCLGGVGGADARVIEATASTYIAAKDLAIGQGETANDGWLGVVGQAPQTPAFHSPLSASVYEHLLLPTFGRVDMQRIVRDVHAPILRYWGSKYGTGYPNIQSPVAPGFDLFWWRADENVSLADTPTGAIAAWAPVACGFQWQKANSTLMQDDGQPRRHPVVTMPVLTDVLMLADGRRLLARQT